MTINAENKPAVTDIEQTVSDEELMALSDRLIKENAEAYEVLAQ